MLRIGSDYRNGTPRVEWLGLLGWSVLRRGGRLGRYEGGPPNGGNGADGERLLAALRQRPASMGSWVLNPAGPARGDNGDRAEPPPGEAGQPRDPGETDEPGEPGETGEPGEPGGSDRARAFLPAPALRDVTVPALLAPAARLRVAGTPVTCDRLASLRLPPVQAPPGPALPPAPRPPTVMAGPAEPAVAAPGTARRVLWWGGVVLMSAGALIGLYLVYLLWFTNFQTDAAQNEMRAQWQQQQEVTTQPEPVTVPVLGAGTVRWLLAEAAGVQTDPKPLAVPTGEAYAVMWFVRPETGERIVHEDPLFVVEGTTPTVLQRGPGHYTDTEGPGEEGNFAVSGHRTTYGAPFYNLQELRPGDQIHVVDRAGRWFVYSVTRTRLVHPTDVWVLEDDPLDTGGGEPMVTLTTCHPRFSAAQRLIVFGELAGRGSEQSPDGLPAELAAQ